MNEKNFFHKRKSAPALLYEMEAPSTLIPIFLKTDIFFSVLAFRTQTAFSGTKNAGFQKRSLEWSFFENAGLEGSSGRTKT